MLKARGGGDGVARFAISTSSRQAFFVFKSPKTEKNVNALVLPATWKPAAFKDEWAEVCAPHPAHTRNIPHHRPWLVCRWRRPSMCCTIRRSRDDGTTCPSSSQRMRSACERAAAIQPNTTAPARRRLENGFASSGQVATRRESSSSRDANEHHHTTSTTNGIYPRPTGICGIMTSTSGVERYRET